MRRPKDSGTFFKVGWTSGFLRLRGVDNVLGLALDVL